MIVFTAIVPHPPMSIPGIGSRQDLLAMQKTLEAFGVLRRDLENASLDVVVIISPHAPLEPYEFIINSDPILKGSLSQFGSNEVAEFRNDKEIAELIEYACEQNEIPVRAHSHLLDHGALIPLYHLTKNIQPQVVHLSFSFLDLKIHYSYGELIKTVCKASHKRIAIIASGDLSHRLTLDAPAGYSSQAKFFDRRIIESLGERDYLRIFDIHRESAEEAAECGLRSFVILLGTIHGEECQFDQLSYEHPFGIGYLVARYV